MNKLYYLSSCSTCKRIIKQWPLIKTIDLIDIKKNPLTDKDLEELYKITNSYESLFNNRAQMLKKVNLSLNLLNENDFKKLLLTHYSFLKRPVLLIKSKIFIGNSKKNIEDAEIELTKK
jgi:arsenate reductase (glutaredoxin)